MAKKMKKGLYYVDSHGRIERYIIDPKTGLARKRKRASRRR